jgi:phosphonopyruvate decarboxylase
MVDVKLFFEEIKDLGIDFFTGVPDSLLKDICAYITSNSTEKEHIIAANEGNAVGLAIGHYLAKKKLSLIYLQNSGLGNVVNPLTSLADPLVYGIPMLIMIGWRGEISQDGDQIKDEPQHKKQGKITIQQLEILNIPYRIIDKNTKTKKILKELVKLSITTNNPVAILIRKGTFSKFELNNDNNSFGLISRELAISKLIEFIPKDVPIVSTTGKPSRELFELRVKNKSGNFRDFLTVGGMGHASSIASGLANSLGTKRVVCLDGDGALLMHTGALAISAKQKNLIHIVLNNGAHDSVGGQPTEAINLKLDEIAEKFNYDFIYRAENEIQIEEIMKLVFHKKGSVFIEIICKKGSRSNLARPNKQPLENKNAFMSFIKKLSKNK